ncbi:MAG: hypothetical protein HOA57_02960 [Candidatus Magasanikbacteria bacterium]|jgi:hypothetical protein|nr:hypothetical protein [Candidatus Magasanikbacteria bacterium]MBT4314523.1 hypothetical protein [Candidatus Magasanikbacteria bacterium]MBT4547643.1 hypothetical protein [Candidatus Magasanikbacteria bacterium]MBT6819312.1 hypothetical protein [Candidatus Magasanikbacteria bacterium]
MKTLVKKKLTQLFSIVKKTLPQKISHKRSAVFLFLLIVFVGIVLYAEPSYAQGTIEKIGDYIGDLITRAFMGMASFFIKMAIFFLQYFIAIAQWNNYLDVATVMLGWTMVRDVANMFFVVILLVIAFGTILGIEQYQWNKTLIKLILAAVFINFSNLICGIFIDAAHVFTITFVNAISATAGGNFIQAFNIEKLFKLVGKPESVDATTDFSIGLLVAALASLLFSILAMCIIAAYAMIMLARMVALWVLVIFSPLAFILQVLPGTQSYAKQWWDKFMKQVLVAPVMVFFLWLTFATVGSGGVQGPIDQGGIGLNVGGAGTEESSVSIGAGLKGDVATSLSDATTWANMASFFIPLALMIVGMNVVTQMGVVGGGLVQSGQAMAKKIAGYATGYNTARAVGSAAWRKSKDVAGKGAKKFLMEMPGGGHMWQRAGKRIQDARKYNPVLSRIPFLGNYRETWNKKMNDRADKTSKMKEETALKNMGKAGEPITSAAFGAVTNWLPKKLAAAAGNIQMGDETLADKLDINEWKKGGFGLSAATARRDASEKDYMAAIDMRSPMNKQMRMAANEAELRTEAIELIVSMQNESFDGWAEKEGLYDGIDTNDEEALAEKRKELWSDDETRNRFNESDEADELVNGKKGMKAVNKSNKLFFTSRKNMATRNMARAIWTSEEVDTLREELEAAKSKSTEAVMDVESADGLIKRRAEAGLTKGTAADRIKMLQSMYTVDEVNKAEAKVADAQDEANGEVDELRTKLGLEKNKDGSEKWSTEQIDEQAKELRDKLVKEQIEDDPIANSIYMEHRANMEEARAKEARSDFNKALGQTDVGKELFQKMQDAEIGAKIGEDFVKQIKDTRVKAKFEEARDKLAEAQGDPIAIKNLLEENKYASAIHESEESEATGKLAAAARDQATKSHADAQDSLAKILENSGVLTDDEEKKKKIAREVMGEDGRTAREKMAAGDVAKRGIASYMETMGKTDERTAQASVEMETINDAIRIKEAEFNKLEDAGKAFEGMTMEQAQASITHEGQLIIEDQAVINERVDRVKNDPKNQEQASLVVERLKTEKQELVTAQEQYVKEAEESSKPLEEERNAISRSAAEIAEKVKSGELSESQEKDELKKLEDRSTKHNEAVQVREDKMAEATAELNKQRKEVNDAQEELDSLRGETPEIKEARELLKTEKADHEKSKEQFDIRFSMTDTAREEKKQVLQAEIDAATRDKEDFLDSNIYASDVYYKQLAEEDKTKEESARSQLSTSFWGTQKALDSLDRQVNADLGNMADNALKSLKSKTVQQKYKKVKDKIQEASRGEGDLTLEQLVQKNVMVKAAVLAREGKDDELLEQLEKDKFVVEVSSSIVDPSLRGFGLSSGVVQKFIEEYKREMDLMGEGERGEKVSDNVLMLSGLNVKGKKADGKQSLFAAAAYESAQFNGNVDDAISAMANKMNLLDIYDSKKTDDERRAAGLNKKTIDSITEDRESWDQLKYMANRFNWAEKRVNNEGQMVWTDNADAKASGTFELYMNTGGDLELVERAHSINEIRDNNEDLSLEEASEKYFQENASEIEAEGERASIKNYKDLMGRYAEYQDIFRSVSESRKEHSKKTGHTQLGFNVMFDSDTGMVRLNSKNEQTAAKAGTLSKDASAAANPQGFGRYDNMNGRQLYVSAEDMRIHKLGSAKTITDFQRLADDRMRRCVFLGTNRAKQVQTDDDGFAMLGDSSEYLEGRGFGDELVGAYDQLFKVIGQSLVGGGNNTALAVAVETGQDSIAAQNGRAKMTLAGQFAEELKSKGTEDFAKNIKKFLENKQTQVVASLRAKMDSGNLDFNETLQVRENIMLYGNKEDRNILSTELQADFEKETDKAQKARLKEQIMALQNNLDREVSVEMEELLGELTQTATAFHNTEKEYMAKGPKQKSADQAQHEEMEQGSGI